MAGTVYAPGSSQSTYYKKLAQASGSIGGNLAAGLQQNQPAIQPAAPQMNAGQAMSQDLTAMGIPPGSMTMGPTGYLGGGNMGNVVVGNGIQSTIGQQPAGGGVYNGIIGGGAQQMAQQAGPTIYAPGQDVYGAQQNPNGPTIYAPPAQQPNAPALNQNRSSFMTNNELQGYRQVIPNGGNQANGSGGGSIGGNLAQPTTVQLQQIAAQLQASYDAANKANQGRYDQLLGLADQFGQTQMQQNQNQTTRELGAGTTSLINRGLGNSTIVDSTRRGTLQASNQRADNIANTVAQNRAGIIERRTDEGPNLGLYAQLLSQPGGAAIASTLLDATAKKKGK